jgi:hypothetical protein
MTSLSCWPGQDDRAGASGEISLIKVSSAMGEAVGDSVCGIAAGVDRESALQFMVSGFVQEIADRNHPSHSASEENELASGSALAQRLCHGI